MPAFTDLPEPPVASLPSRLRSATQALHASTERSGVMGQLLAGHLTHAGYLHLLFNLRAVYEALENALSAQAHQPWLGSIDANALHRLPALEADLQAAGQARRDLVPDTQAYVERLVILGQREDPTLLAHVYTRYLGDLHGGQIMQRMVRRLYPGQSTAFHDFGDEARVRHLRDELRGFLAAAPLSAEQSDRVVAEACWSFEQHRRIFEALALPAETP